MVNIRSNDGGLLTNPQPLEAQVASLTASMAQITQTLQDIQARHNGDGPSQRRDTDGQNGQQGGHNGGGYGRLTKVEFPKFEGEEVLVHFGARISVSGYVEYGVNEETPQVDLDDNQIDPVYKVKNRVVYPAFDPDIPWDKMEPILGMRYETPQQLKMALANYGVVHGYQLWYMKNDWRQVLVYCGRNVVEGKCAGKKGNKHRVLPKKVRTSLFRGDEGNQASKKPVKKHVKKLVKKPVNKKPDSQSGEGTSQSPKWTKKQIQNSKKVNCPFRLYALWMSREQLVQIKSLRSEHKCCRNHNLGSLVTYKWIAMQYFKEIIRSISAFKEMREMTFDKSITIISDSHKGLIDAVIDWLLEAEHRKCTRHIYANFKKKYSGLTIIETIVGLAILLEHKNPNSWSRAFFEMDMRCAAFENGISEKF
ncbi:hypothetical protein Tco_0505354 [Tanacetum coccineum]